MPPSHPLTIARAVSTGVMRTAAVSLGRTRIFSGGMFMVLSASTSLYTVMEASSAVVADPTRPARRMATITGASSRQRDNPTMLPMKLRTPSWLRTKPV
ncbi:MAG: hypothetical protein BWY82_02397 [Verrucomicrobia bacterium ADurb.Bin474]|nr:MAG: hypothetical protein BWY82_02397 [Verrucomicrobia bacterium ADurb.Bin474]